MGARRLRFPLLVAAAFCMIIPAYFSTKKAMLRGGYTEWSKWDDCSAVCGVGTQKRTRNCTNPPQGRFGSSCARLGSSSEEKECKVKECPIDGGWSDWGDYGGCDKTCGEGAQKRTRSCTNPPPQYEGKVCEGSSEETKACNEKPCPVDGGFTEWGSFGDCDKTCDSGVQKRTRSCTNPPPSNGGKNCDGPTEETQACNTQACPGVLSEWTNYGACDRTCGTGVQARNRTCAGGNCQGALVETQECNTQACP